MLKNCSINQLIFIIIKNYFSLIIAFCLFVLSASILFDVIHLKPATSISPIGDLKVEPQMLSFEHFQIEKTHVGKFKIRNLSMRRQPLKIITKPQKNAPFEIKYDQKKEIESCGEVDVMVYFKPSEHRYFSQNLEVKLGDSLDNVELRAFSTFMNKRHPKFNTREKSDLEAESSQSQDARSQFQNPDLIFEAKRDNLKNFKMDKEINFEKLIGNLDPTETDRQIVWRERANYEAKEASQKRKKISARHQIEQLKECPIHDRGSNQIVKWNDSKNNNKMMLQSAIKKFQFSISKIIKEERFDRIRKILSNYMEEKDKETAFEKIDNQINNVIQSKLKWKKGENIALPEEMEFSKFSIRDKVVYSEQGNLIAHRDFKFQIDPRVSFDDWIPVAELAENNCETMRYERLPEPAIVMHPPIIKINRKEGAYGEYPYIEYLNSRPNTENKNLNIVLTLLSVYQFEPITYCEDIEPQIFHTFKASKYYETPKLNQMEDFLMDQIDDLSDNKFYSSKFFNGLNCQRYHYQKLDVQNKYDVGFWKDIEKHSDCLIDGPTLEDKIDEETLKKLIDNQRSKDVSFSKLKRQSIAKKSTLETNNGQKWIKNMENSLAQIKRQGLATTNTLLNSYNLKTIHLENRMIL